MTNTHSHNDGSHEEKVAPALSTMAEYHKHFHKRKGVNKDVVAVNKMLIDVAGDLNAGLILNQIVYWYLPSSSAA